MIYKFKEVATFKYGKMPQKELIKDTGYPIYTGYKISGYYPEYMYEEEKLIVVARGVGGTGDVKLSPKRSFITNLSIIVELDESKCNKNFMMYYLNSRNLRSLDSGSAQSQITINDLSNFEVQLPNIETQSNIASFLLNIDKKIEINNKIIANLEAQAQAIFKSRFVDFEPFQDGQFVESELGMIPEGWEVKTLGDFFPVITGKKNANIAIDNGEYPFFTCSQGIFYTDDYSFDANAILLAGNGDFNVKRYNGKFEAYQRTYILIPYDEKYVGLLYNLIEFYLPQIVSGHKGSVINYITKGMIEEFKFAVPNDIPAKTLKLFNDYENFIAHLKKEVKNLEITRDTLLPKLMSGEIRVGQDDIEEIENLL